MCGPLVALCIFAAMLYETLEKRGRDYNVAVAVAVDHLVGSISSGPCPSRLTRGLSARVPRTPPSFVCAGTVACVLAVVLPLVEGLVATPAAFNLSPADYLATRVHPAAKAVALRQDCANCRIIGLACLAAGLVPLRSSRRSIPRGPSSSVALMWQRQHETGFHSFSSSFTTSLASKVGAEEEGTIPADIAPLDTQDGEKSRGDSKNASRLAAKEAVLRNNVQSIAGGLRDDIAKLGREDSNSILSRMPAVPAMTKRGTSTSTTSQKSAFNYMN